MEKIFTQYFSVILISLLGYDSFAQLTPNGNSGSSTTNYTNGSANNPIYIWCADGLSNNTASLTANAPSGVGPFTYNWFFHDQTNFSWTPYLTQTGTSSTISNLPSDGYRVQIYDAGNNLVGCYIAWVWNMNSDVYASNTPTACNGSNLSGTVNVNGSFVYYNPPPPESLINASTQITVCFSATHTWVSDLAFYLVGPAACGSPTILLSPNPGAIGQGTVCNSGDNVNNLCFTTAPAGNLNVCAPAPATLSGTYSSYGPSNTPINWSPLFGCNAAEGGWRVQIYDCIGLDFGSLTNATITFSNLTSICGSPTTITYTSGAINSAINDNSCSAGSASIFQVPITSNLTSPIMINASASYVWTADQSVTIPSASASLTPSVASVPAGTTNFILTATISYGSIVCTNDAVTTFVNTCCSATADAGTDVNFCTGENSQIGTPALPNTTYSWSPAIGLSDATVAQPIVTLTNAGSTPQNITYTLTVTNVLDGGCTDLDDVIVTVNPLPTVNLGSYPVTCSNAADLSLNGTPGGGTFSGVGVSGNLFDPSVGTQTITYNFTDGNGCSNNVTSTIIVVDPSLGSAGSYTPVCADAADVALSGTPSGGTFSGTGVTGNNFDPSFGTQNVTYSYTDANGCSNTANSTITVNELPVADAGNNMSLCSGSSVVLSGSGIGTPTWSPSTDLSSSSVLSPTATPSSTTVYTLTIDNGFCTDSDQVTVTVTSSPNLTLTQNTSICVGDCIDLNVSGADFYSWEPAPGITDTTLQTQNVCPAVTTTYTVHGYTIGGSAMTNGDFEGGATGFNSDYTLNSNTQTEGTYFVTTNANLTHPGFTGLDHTTGSGNFLVVNGSSTPNSSVWCQTVAVQPNTNYVFSTWVSTLAIGSPAVLQFSINGINISDPFTAPSVTGVWDEFYTTWNSGSQTTATICIVNQNTSLGGNDFGIDDIFFSAVCPTTETVTITVNEPANATITPVGPFCISGSAVTLQVAQTGGSWSGNGVNASTGSFNPAIAGAGTHNITYTIGGPCGDSDMIQIVVNPLPLADVGVDQEVCAGDAVTLTATGGTSYTWSNGVTNGVPFVPVATTVYTVTVTDANGCEETDNVTVTVNPLPTINGGPDVTVCEGTQVTLNGSGGASYLWNNGGTDGQPFTPAVGTTVFTVTGTDANGCVNTDNVNVTALPMPVADIEADINSGFPVLSVNFTNNSANANSYSWNFDNGQLNTVSSTSPQSTSYSEPGTYVVYMIADNGVCQVTDTVHIIVIPFPDPWIHIPNVFTPNGDGANDEFTIQTSYVAEMEIQIYNRWGEFIDEIIGTTDFWNGQFNGKDASDGTYFFKYYVKGINGKELTGHGNVTLIR